MLIAFAFVTHRLSYFPLIPCKFDRAVSFTVGPFTRRALVPLSDLRIRPRFVMANRTFPTIAGFGKAVSAWHLSILIDDRTCVLVVGIALVRWAGLIRYVYTTA